MQNPKSEIQNDQAYALLPNGGKTLNCIRNETKPFPIGYSHFAIHILIALFLIASHLPARAAEAENKSRLIFGNDAKKAESSLQKVVLPADTTPQQQINAFFLLLMQKKIDSAYDLLLRDTIIGARSTDKHQLKAQTTSAIDTYGDIRGFELLSDEPAGKHLLRLTYLSLNTNLPLRWRFYFYKTPNAWRLIDVRIDDALAEIFPKS